MRRRRPSPVRAGTGPFVLARLKLPLSEQLHDGALQYVLAARQDLDEARDTGRMTSALAFRVGNVRFHAVSLGTCIRTETSIWSP